MKDITTLFQDFQGDLEKQEYIRKQYEVILSLSEKNKALEIEVAHLKTLLINQVPVLAPVQSIIITPEEGLIESQLKILSERAYTHELTLEEMKKVDLLLKNKKLISQKDDSIDVSPKLEARNLPRAELIQIARDNIVTHNE